MTYRRPWNNKYLHQVSTVAYYPCLPCYRVHVSHSSIIDSPGPQLSCLTLPSCLPPLPRLLLLLTHFLVDMEYTAATADQRCTATYPGRRARRHAYRGRGRRGRWREKCSITSGPGWRHRRPLRRKGQSVHSKLPHFVRAHPVEPVRPQAEDHNPTVRYFDVSCIPYHTGDKVSH